MMNNGPTFMCIGAQKAGTTWLYENLSRHPDVAMPPIKEIHYFDELYLGVKTGLRHRIFAREGLSKWWWKEKMYDSFRHALRKKKAAHVWWCVRYFFFRRSLDWYDRLFENASGKVSGDITPDYCILGKNTVEIIRSRYPNLKIIYLIRNPVDRAWSALKMRYVHRRGMKIEDIDESLMEEYYEKFRKFNDIQRTITNWTHFFPREQFYIGFYDDLIRNPAHFLEKILDFLGLEHICDAQTAGRKVFKGVHGVMPERMKVLLCRKNIDQIRFLENYFIDGTDKHPETWRIEAEQIINRIS